MISKPHFASNTTQVQTYYTSCRCTGTFRSPYIKDSG